MDVRVVSRVIERLFAIDDRLIEMREQEGLTLHFLIQVDTLCHRIPNFIAKAARAGCTRVFIGLENINPDNLIAAKKRQNKITDYREMLQQWRAHGALTCAGYIIGFPSDTKESILRDIEIIKRELPLDILEFFLLTPLPGSACTFPVPPSKKGASALYLFGSIVFEEKSSEKTTLVARLVSILRLSQVVSPVSLLARA